MKRHIIRTLIGTCLLLLTFTTAKAFTSPYSCNDNKACRMAAGQLRGDLNGDGSRTVLDVTMLVNYILTNQGDFELWAGDLDNNGAITVSDVTILVNIILGAAYNDPDNPALPLDGLEGEDPGNGL